VRWPASFRGTDAIGRCEVGDASTATRCAVAPGSPRIVGLRFWAALYAARARMIADLCSGLAPRSAKMKINNCVIDTTPTGTVTTSAAYVHWAPLTG
jgi:hypothetical protein